MRIVHIAPNATFDDGWGFQDNLLPKYQQKLGHDITLLVRNVVHDGQKKKETIPERFQSIDGFAVERIAYTKQPSRFLTQFLCKLPVYDRLMELQPDLVFCHGLMSTTILDVIRYKKMRKRQGKDCIILQDNHLDYNIGTDPKTIKDKILRTYYRMLNRKSQKYVERVYGVTPWRVQYAQDYYKINSALTDVLIMGADDEKIDLVNREKTRKRIRAQYGVGEKDFLIVTGGKIDRKKKIHLLMEACSNMPGVQLLVFGNVSADLQEEYDRILAESQNIHSIGWISADKVYDYFFAADLVFFPGQHSVLWEQACAAKVPCVFGRWPGMDHVNNGGNAQFIENPTARTIREKIQSLHFTQQYEQMRVVAQSDATDIYLYSEIAKKSLSGIRNIL